MAARSGIPRSLRLFIPDVPPSYDGRLYFILGPGLGDTVNDFRILHEVMALYPKATPVVYADPRWSELYALVPDLKDVPIRFHREAPSGEREGQRKQYPYYRTFQSTLQEICVDAENSSGLVALGGLKCPDQLARKDSNIHMRARAIGLSLLPDRCRPFLPIGEHGLTQARRFLDAQGLSPGRYFAVAPHSFVDKMWQHEAWESVIEELHRATSLPILVLGVPGYREVRGKMVREAIGCPLPLVAGLLSLARCFMGLDSGLTHLAACFDVPIVALNPQGKFPPFLVEAHSPFRWTVLTPGVYGSEPISVAAVFEVVCRALANSAPPACPLCGKNPYVLGAGKRQMLYLCPCGLIVRDGAWTANGVSLAHDWREPISLPTTVTELESLASYLRQLSNRRRSAGTNVVAVSFEHWDPVGADPLALLTASSRRELWWNWDAAYGFVTRCGWRAIESEVSPAPPGSGAALSIRVRLVPASTSQQDSVLRVPWGRKVIQVRASTYERWLSWGCFRKQDELEGIGQQLAKEGEWRQGREILLLALKLRPRMKTLTRLVRGAWQALTAPGASLRPSRSGSQRTAETKKRD